MRFFESQLQARRIARRLIVLYAVSLVFTVLVVAYACTLALILVDQHGFQDLLAGEPLGPKFAKNWPITAFFGGAYVSMIALVAWQRTRALGSRWLAVVYWFGGQHVPANSTDPEMLQLRNVVEEMAIASGVPVPRLFVLENQGSINAFALGPSVHDSALAVTRGCLSSLTRDELQAVVAHEFSHILNGDMRLNLRMMGPLHGLVAVTVLARMIITGDDHPNRNPLAAPSRPGKGIGILFPVAIPMFLFGSVGAFASRAIKATALRQRELLADAHAVQFTRQTDGLVGALGKMALAEHGARLESPRTEEVSHMLFGDGLRASALLSTHPPTMDRLRAIRPSFLRADLAPIAASLRRHLAARLEAHTAAAAPRGPALSAAAMAVAAVATAPAQPVRVASIVARIGSPGLPELQYAAELRRALPASLDAAAHDPAQAPAIVLALLVASGEGPREPQLALLRDRSGDALHDRVAVSLASIDDLPGVQRLPLACMAVAALREMPADALASWRGVVDALIHLDDSTSVFEYALGTLLDLQLVAGKSSNAGDFGALRLAGTLPQLTDLLCVLAHTGHRSDPDAARQAFVRGLHDAVPGASANYVSPRDWTARLDAALPVLDRLDPPSKALLVEAMLVALRHDGVVSVEEGELLRTICAVLHCPLPPLIDRDVT